MVSAVAYYKHPAVRRRLAEYCGLQAPQGGSFTTQNLSGVSESFKPDRVTEEYFFPSSEDAFCRLLDRGVDLFRSVWDTSSTLGILDIEYFNLVYPAEAYFNPVRSFEVLEPVYRGLNRVFRRFGLTTLLIMTGQGYHFSFRTEFRNQAHAELAALGRIGDTLTEKYRDIPGQPGRSVPLEVGLAFDGMGRLMEYVVHLLLRDLGARYRGIPVVCTDLSVGKSREAVSLDLSMYGDPIYMRDIRCPFSTYQKHKYLKGKFGARAAEEIPVFITLPRFERYSLHDLLATRRSLDLSQEYAGEVETKIPESGAGLKRLIRSYRYSKLYRFHRYFDDTRHDDPEMWPLTYDRFDLSSLPLCVSHCLYHPNDNLLKPTNLQALTRVLVKLGWHPKHISGLVRSKLERDYGWGNMWVKYDAATRADFYIRLFAGLLYTGLDREGDLTCPAQREKGYCWRSDCGNSLADYKLR